MIVNFISVIYAQIPNDYFYGTNQMGQVGNMPFQQSLMPGLNQGVVNSLNNQTANFRNGGMNNPISKMKIVSKQPLGRMKAAFSPNPISGNMRLSATLPVQIPQQAIAPPKAPMQVRNFPNAFNSPFPNRGSVLFPPAVNRKAYLEVPPIKKPAESEKQKYVLSPKYFPKRTRKEATRAQQQEKKKESTVQSKVELDEPIQISQKRLKRKEKTKTAAFETMKLDTSVTMAPSIEPYGLEVSTPEEKEIDEDTFNEDAAVGEDKAQKRTKKPKKKSETGKASTRTKEIKSLQDLVDEDISDFAEDTTTRPVPKPSTALLKPSKKPTDPGLISDKLATNPGLLVNEEISADLPVDALRPKTPTRTRPVEVTRTLTSTEHVTATTLVTSTVELPVPETVTVETSYTPTQEEIENETKELTQNVVPRIAGKRFLKKHNEDIVSADRSRKAYIDYKMKESRNNQKRIEGKLDGLKHLEAKLDEKLMRLTNERAEISLEATSSKNSVENNESAIKTLERDQKLNEKLMRLEQLEINKLERAINEEKNKYLILSDQGKMYNERLRSFGKKGFNTRTEMKINENKLEEYDRLLESMRRNADNLRLKILEIEKQKRREVDMQNKLEIERKDIEDSNHIALMALYD